MSSYKALEKMPREGFLKVLRDERVELSNQQRTALIRKGNELFNAGEIEKAKRVFLTAGYGDGLSRIGDHYYKEDRPLEALRMYWLAPAPDKRERLVEKLSSIVQTWLVEDEG